MKGIILDLDGVVYSGSLLFGGALDFLVELRRRSIPVVAVTNHTGYQSSDVARRLEKMGVEFPAEDIITAGWATADYIAEIAPGARVYPVGDPALSAELSQAGLVLLQTDDSEADCDYVVAGYCSEYSRSVFEAAVSFLLKGAELIGTNPDRLLPTPGGPIPEAGPGIAFLERASNQSATVIGKPSPRIIERALGKLGVGADEALIVGDKLETDIAAGRLSGIRTVLIDQGSEKVQTPGRDSTSAEAPDLRVGDLSELCELMKRESDSHAVRSD